jgi:hypothetical protein
MLVDLTDDDVRIAANVSAFCGLDLGKWRWALSFYTASYDRTVTLQDEIFSQHEDIDTRAKKLKALGEYYHWPEYVPIRATARRDTRARISFSNSIRRSNAAAPSGWCRPSRGAQSDHLAGIERVESLMNRGKFKVRRGIGTAITPSDTPTWFLGMQATKPGKPVEGSPLDVGSEQLAIRQSARQRRKVKMQKDKPDDATADGADMMDSTRYAIMSWYTPDEPEPPKYAKTVIQRIQDELRELNTHNQRPDYGRPLRQ